MGSSVGEVVFNTAMTGYQEVLTDPSYPGQIVTITYPFVGNDGVNPDDVESRRPCTAGSSSARAAPVASSFRSTEDLDAYLDAHDVVGIDDVDTRALTRCFRERGALRGGVSAAPTATPTSSIAVGKVLASPTTDGRDLANGDCTTSNDWPSGARRSAPDIRTPEDARLHVVAYDFGIKHNILRVLVGARLRRHGGAGGDARGRRLSRSTRTACSSRTGRAIPSPRLRGRRDHDVVAPASRPSASASATSSSAWRRAPDKMKFGHRGANHPVKDRDTGKVPITSQNHGFAVDATTLSANTRVTHVSLFDGSLQGIARTDRPAFGFQGHPEASPGPHDLGYLFDRFVRMMERK